MNRTDHEELMQRVLDGAASPAEEAALQAALAGSAELRSRYEELQRLFGMLESVSDVEPPPEAVQQVIRDFRARLPQQANRAREDRRGGWLAAAVEALRLRLSPQLAYAFVAGAVAGLALFVAVDGGPRWGFDGGSRGTLPSFEATADSRVLDAVQLQAPGFRGAARTSVGSGALLLEIDCESERAATIHVQWDEPTLLGFDQAQPQALLAAETGGLRIEHSGDNRYRLWFAPDAAPLRVQVQVDGVTLERQLGTVSGSE